jgi:hypothetical protein
MCPRSSYVPLVAAESVAYFREYTAVIDATGAALDSAVWFEDEQTGQPLKRSVGPYICIYITYYISCHLLCNNSIPRRSSGSMCL